ncbi:MAG: hypothetical protein Q7T03_01615 [Deltaproteobacteria bacterium]|nr:hypothetical protein [Deltaproteobacteria bacterium]
MTFVNNLLNMNLALKTTGTFLLVVLLFGMMACSKSHLTVTQQIDLDKKAKAGLVAALVDLPPAGGSRPYPSQEVEKEAREIAQALVDQTRETNKDFKMNTSPKWHNVMIKMGSRKKGYCYQWVPELLKALPPQPMKYFERHWGGSFLSLGRENNAVIITKRSAPLETGLVYDAWRGVGRPFWIPVSQDKHYQWSERFNEIEILTGQAKVEAK